MYIFIWSQVKYGIMLEKLFSIWMLAIQKPMQGALKEKTIILTCFSGTVIVAVLGNWFLGTALIQECRQSPAYSPVYPNASIISPSRKNEKVFKNMDIFFFHLNQG